MPSWPWAIGFGLRAARSSAAGPPSACASIWSRASPWTTLAEAITLFVDGEPESAKLILCDLVTATVGFELLADEIDKPAKSLRRMLSQSGDPTMTNASAIFAVIKRAEGRGSCPGRDGLSVPGFPVPGREGKAGWERQTQRWRGESAFPD